MSFCDVDIKRFPAIKLLKNFLNAGAMAPTILNATNEELVELFLSKKIKFLDIVKNINKILKDKEFKKYAKKRPKNLIDIYKVDAWARLKTHSISVR